jgi:hypothetical protein
MSLDITMRRSPSSVSWVVAERLLGLVLSYDLGSEIRRAFLEFRHAVCELHLVVLELLVGSSFLGT